MLSAKYLTILALLATSTSALTLGNHQPLRRHSHRAVVGARTEPVPPVAKRDILPAPGKRGINVRRCAPKNPSSLSVSSTPSATSADPSPTDSQSDPEPTTTSAQPTTTKSNSPPHQQSTKTTTSPKPTPTDNGGSSSGGSSSGGSDTYTGDATFYGTGLGACGITNKDSDLIAAASHLLFDGFNGYTGGDPNQNPICNKKVTAHYQGKSVTVIITDRCVGCAYGDLDFSPAAFDRLADESLGRLKGMTWSFI